MSRWDTADWIASAYDEAPARNMLDRTLYADQMTYLAGDLLPKNFGVTRHGRVVCYDYDELSLLTELSFRAMPASSSYDDEFGDEPWFGVTPLDVFPEEFPTFIALPPELKALLGETHGNLYELSFWLEIQQRVRTGEIVDIFPYSAERRLERA